MKKLILAITGLLLLLSSCDNLVDLSDQGTVTVKMASAGSSRYIAGGGETVDEAILGFVEQDVMYNFDFIEEITDFTGEYMFTGIPVGDYSFLAMLLADDEVISMAIQPVTIEAGKNDLIIEMGPGFYLTINTLDFDIGDLNEDFTLSLNDNEITIGLPADQIESSNMDIVVTSNARSVLVLDSDDNVLTDGTVNEGGELYQWDHPFSFNPTEYQRLNMELESFDDSINEYVLIFKAN